MNICVFGGGGKPGKFGYDFCNKAKSQGHKVFAFSHQPHEDNIVIDYNNLDQVVEAFESVLNSAPIDLVLYNATAGSYPFSRDQFSAIHNVSTAQWSRTLQIPVVVPHALGVVAQRYMKPSSAMVFMGSGLARNMDRSEWTTLTGYAGGKAVQTHLMIGLAHNNSNQMIFSSIYPYLGPLVYHSVFEKIYNHLMHITPDWNGRIFEAYN